MADRQDTEDLDGFASLASDDDPEVRGRTASALGSRGSLAIPILVSLLDDPDDRVQMEAISSLGDIGDPMAIEPLMPLLEDGAPETVRQVLAAFAKIGDQRAFGPVIARVFDVDDGIRANAVAAAGGIGDPRALEPLLMCISDDSERVRANSAWSLGRLGVPDPIPALTKLSDSADSDDVRACAVSALGSIAASCAEVFPDDSRQALEYVIDVLDDPEERSRVRASAAISCTEAIRDLGASGTSAWDNRAVTVLSVLASDGSDEDLRSTSIWCLGRLFEGCGSAHDGGGDIVTIVSAALADGGEWSIRYSLEALARIGGSRCLEAVESFSSTDASESYRDLCDQALDLLQKHS